MYHLYKQSPMSLDSEPTTPGFQVKYLGSVSFTRKKRQPLKGIASLQRPLLDLYTGARRKGEHHRSVHPLALTQQLEVCDYGLVVAEGTGRGETVVTKVVTPLSNVVLWAAVRFHARVIRRRVFGAAFVPIACSDGVLDHKCYVGLGSKQRFLVSLTHPSVFACLYRRVSSPSVFECHAFVCATAEEALAVASLASMASRQSALPRRFLVPAPPRSRRLPASVDSGTDYYTPSDVTPASRDVEDRAVYGGSYRDPRLPRTDTEEESNSYASVVQKVSCSPRVGGRRFVPGGRSPRMSKPHTHHREARAYIGRRRTTGEPLLDDQQRSTSSYEKDDTRKPKPAFKDTSTMTDRTAFGGGNPELRPPTEVLAETIDLSSESAKSSTTSSTAGWRPVPAANTPLVKYTYFGYETYARPKVGATTTTTTASGNSSDSTTPRRGDPGALVDGETVKKSGMVEQQRRAKNRKGHHTRGSDVHPTGIIKGNGTGKVTINVPFDPLRPESRISSASSRTIPHGVRSFQKHGHVRNWSSLSQTSASSSSSYQRSATIPPSNIRSVNRGHHPQQKMLRWSSEDRLPRRQRGGFFWSLKRLSIQSLTKAKHKTGKFISSVRTKLMGNKRSSADGSEDSAYDTSEVCLSPTGRQGSSPMHRQPAPRSAARRQQSWSFHDLRTAAVERPISGSRRTQNGPHRRKHRRRRKLGGRGSSSSDSGVEAAYHSDCSVRKSGSDPGLCRSANGVTRVEIQHGMSAGTFQRWSHTNIHEELGYIP